VGKLEGKNLSERPWHRWVDGIKIYLRGDWLRESAVDSFGQAGFCKHGDEFSCLALRSFLYLYGVYFIDHLCRLQVYSLPSPVVDWLASNFSPTSKPRNSQQPFL
jgi:hypothetical protein